MKSSASESIRNACFNLERLFSPSLAGNFAFGTTLIQTPNLMHKLLFLSSLTEMSIFSSAGIKIGVWINSARPNNLVGVDKTRNTEHSGAGTLRKIPEHPGTWKNKKKINNHEKKKNTNKMIFVKIVISCHYFTSYIFLWIRDISINLMKTCIGQSKYRN